MSLGCFPSVTTLHTLDIHHGQVYSVNYLLMVLSLAIVVGFKDGVEISNAYGVAAIWVMLLTTCLMTLVMLVIWKTKITTCLMTANACHMEHKDTSDCSLPSRVLVCGCGLHDLPTKQGSPRGLERKEGVGEKKGGGGGGRLGLGKKREASILFFFFFRVRA